MGRRALKRKRMTSNERQVPGKKDPLLDSDLLIAVREKDHKRVSEIIESSSGSIPERELNSALFQAVEIGDRWMVHFLLHHGCSISSTDRNGNTPLLIATRHGHMDIVKMLRCRGSNVNHQNYDGQTCLMLATQSACLSALLEYFGYGTYNADLQNENGKTILMMATEIGDIAAMGRIIGDNPKMNMELKDEEGNTTFDVATRKGIQEHYNLLLEWKDSGFDKNPIMSAVLKNSIQLLRSFLSGYFNINQMNRKGYTALMLGLGADQNHHCGHGLGANQNHHCGHGLGANQNHQHPINMEIIELLLQWGADSNMPSKCSKMNSLMYAAKSGNVKVINLLMQYGADIGGMVASESITPLMIAAQFGQADMVNLLLDKGAKLDSRDRWGQSALQYAVQHNKKEVIKLLIERGATINLGAFCNALDKKLYRLFPLIPEDFLSPVVFEKYLSKAIKENDIDQVDYLFNHIKCGCVKSVINATKINRHLATASPKIVKLLIDNGADVNKEDEAGHTALILAVLMDNCEQIEVLINHGADTKQTIGGKTPLMMAIESKSTGLKALRALVNAGTDVNFCPSQSRDGLTPLHLCISVGNASGCSLLLDSEIDIEQVDEKGRTPLMLAVSNYISLPMVKALVIKGAKLNCQSPEGDTALIIATRCGEKGAVEILVRSGANVNLSNALGETALMIAVQTLTFDIVQMLAQYDADVNAVDCNGNTVLLQAVTFSAYRTDTVSFLISKGARINISDASGVTPLIRAAQQGNKAILDCLIESGAELNPRDINGLTPLIHASSSLTDKSGFNVALLVDKGADVHIQDNNGCDALILAAMKCNLEVVKILLKAGAHVHTVDNNHRNALWYAMLNFHFAPHFPQLNQKCLSCMEHLLEKGAVPDMSELRAVALFHSLITGNEKHLIELLVQSGIAPPELPVKVCSQFNIIPTAAIAQHFDIPEALVSPLSMAIVFRNVELIEFFVKNSFLSSQDVALTRKRNTSLFRIIKFLISKKPSLSATLGTLINGPWSLLSLSLIAVSSSVPNCRNRGEKIKSLPIPTLLQKVLHHDHSNLHFPKSAIFEMPKTALLGLNDMD